MIPATSPAIKAPTPRLISSLTAGFNLVASHIWVILFPILLDVLLWFGPRLRISDLVRPYLNDWFASMAAEEGALLGQSLSVAQSNIQQVLDETNLLGSLSGFPIGIPSLLSSAGFSVNPLGSASIFEMPSPEIALLIWILISLAGIVIGSLFFNYISRLSAAEKTSLSLPAVLQQIGQSVLLVLILFATLVLLAIPLFLLASVFIMIAPYAAQISLTLAFFAGFWLLLPLYFCTHGIFVYQQTALSSIVTSRRLVRAFLPGVTIFILATVLLTFGLDALWLSAPMDSWLTLVGITGHAFISSSILAASFIYYRTGIQWLQEYMQKITNRQTNATPNLSR